VKVLAHLALALVLLALPGCTQEGRGRRPIALPAATVVGPAQSCVLLRELGQSVIRDDWTIDFIGDRGHVWRNTLSGRCSGLRASRAFLYETSLTQLCNTDIIYVLETTDRTRRGAACGLGDFMPVKLRD